MEGHMQSIFHSRSVIRFALALLLAAIVPACMAQAAFPAAHTLDKHARRLHKRLTRYSSGTYVSVVLRDGSHTAGALGAVDAASLTMTNSDTNAPETHAYMEVASVQKSREYIGEGSQRHIHWVRWGLVGAAAAGAAVTAVALY
jgi:hypothetical protein